MLTVGDTDVDFYNESTGATNYEWSFSSDNQIYLDEHPKYNFIYDEEADYSVKLVAISSIGCRDSIYSLIPVKEELIFYIPNTFSPNEDEYNQTFKPVFSYGFNPQEYVLNIFNRWGELIFESRNVEFGWDGSYGTWTESKNQIDNCLEGTYTWKIEFTLLEDDSRISRAGNVNLIR
jgi:gliding motility-associated-like protein